MPSIYDEVAGAQRAFGTSLGHTTSKLWSQDVDNWVMESLFLPLNPMVCLQFSCAHQGVLLKVCKPMDLTTLYSHPQCSEDGDTECLSTQTLLTTKGYSRGFTHLTIIQTKLGHRY